MQTDTVFNDKKTGAGFKLSTIVKVAMLSAIAVVLMLLEFPLPFIAPPFYEMDFSEVPVLIGAFAMGPLVGIIIEAVKVLLNLVINGTITGGVGEMANFAIGCAFIVPASLIYKFHKTKKSAFIGLGIGMLVMAALGCILNAYVLLPAYGKALNIPIDVFIGMGQAIHPSIDSIMSFVLLTVLPFNILKGLLSSLIVILIYKRIRHLFG